MHLGHAAIEMSGEAALGLRMGRLSRLAHAGLAGVTAAQAPTLGEAARTLLRFEPLYAANYRGRSRFVEDAQGAWLRFYSISPYNDYNRFVVDSLLAGWLAQLTDLAGTPVQAERLEIEFAAPSYAARYQPLCSTPVQFAADGNQLRLSRATLQLANQGIAQVPGSTCCNCARQSCCSARGCAAWVSASPTCWARCSMAAVNRTWKKWRCTCSCQAGPCAASSPRKARVFATCSTKHGATWPRPTSVTRRWPLARLPICWGLLRPRPSSAHSSAGRASRRGVPPQPAAAGLEFGGVVGRFRGVQFVSLGFSSSSWYSSIALRPLCSFCLCRYRLQPKQVG